MSLILDALKRAERERNADAVPAPGDVSVPRTGRAQPRGRRWLLLGGVAIAVVALVAAALAWKRGKPDAPQAQVAQPQAQPELPPIKARPAPPADAPPVIPGTEAVASLDDLTDEPPVDSEPVPVPEPVPTPPQQQAQPQPEPQPEAPAPQPQAVEPQTPVPTEPAAESPPPEIPSALTQQAPLRKFREMPPDYRADFPALKVEIHVYEKAVQKRFVMVNGRRYRQGERLAEGPQLVEIVPEGMVLEFRGEKILFPLSR